MKKFLKYFTITISILIIAKFGFNLINESFAKTITSPGKKIKTKDYSETQILIETFRRNGLNYLKQNDLNKLKKLEKEIKSINKSAGNPITRAQTLWFALNELEKNRQIQNEIDSKKFSFKLSIQYYLEVDELLFKPLADLTKDLYEHSVMTNGLTKRINEKPTHSG